MMVPSIDENDVCVALPHRPRRSNPCKSAADDHDARPLVGLRYSCGEFQRFCYFAHWQTYVVWALTLSAAT
jgi:hypothetical protein